MEKYIPKSLWVDSRVEGLGRTWYYGGYEEMTSEELQKYLDIFNAVVFYDDELYDKVDDIPFKQEYESISKYGMPTGHYILDYPKVTVVPKGTRYKIHPYLGGHFVFPK